MEDGTLATLGKYETRGILGRGAMGTVYEGWDPVIARKVAIKTVPLPDLSDLQAQEELARFKREAQAAGRLSHPNIVGVFDYGETDTLAFIVMEFIDGQTLKSLLDKGERLPVGEVVRIMDELLTGLQFSHDRGVVHRDIKPANVILTRGTNGPGGINNGQVKIADFGIARIESSSMTQAGTVLGTPAYMSPEQFMGQTVDARTDLYSSGIVLYQLLTGERPFEGGFSAIMHKALNTVPPRPSEISVTAPAGLDAVVARAISKRPDERFSSAAEFARALRTAMTAPVAAVSDETTIQPPPEATRSAVRPPAPAMPASPAKPPSRLPLFVAVGVAAVVAVGGGTWFALRPSQAPMEAPRAAAATPAFPLAGAATAAAPVTSAAGPGNQVVAAGTSAGTEPKLAMAPAPQPAEPVVPPPPPLPSIDKAALATALAGAPCSLIGGDVVPPGDTVSLNGLVGKGGAEAAARHAIEQVAPGATIDWHVTSFDGPYCRVLDLLRAQGARFGNNNSGFTLSLAGDHDRVLLHDGELITLRMTMPDFPAQLVADYFQHDGSVFHMHPTVSDGPRLYPAGSRQSLGDPGAGGARWEVGEPYGTDLVVAVASSVPLLSPRRAESETADTYLRELQTALDAAHKRGVRIAVAAIILETAAKK